MCSYLFILKINWEYVLERSLHMVQMEYNKSIKVKDSQTFIFR